jgi:hypothetical protein
MKGFIKVPLTSKREVYINIAHISAITFAEKFETEIWMKGGDSNYWTTSLRIDEILRLIEEQEASQAIETIIK